MCLHRSAEIEGLSNRLTHSYRIQYCSRGLTKYYQIDRCNLGEESVDKRDVWDLVYLKFGLPRAHGSGGEYGKLKALLFVSTFLKPCDLESDERLSKRQLKSAVEKQKTGETTGQPAERIQKRERLRNIQKRINIPKRTSEKKAERQKKEKRKAE